MRPCSPARAGRPGARLRGGARSCDALRLGRAAAPSLQSRPHRPHCDPPRSWRSCSLPTSRSRTCRRPPRPPSGRSPRTGAVGSMNSITADPGCADGRRWRTDALGQPLGSGGGDRARRCRVAARASRRPTTARSRTPTLAALGDALRQAGGITAAVGIERPRHRRRPSVPLRPAELVATDSGGTSTSCDGDDLIADEHRALRGANRSHRARKRHRLGAGRDRVVTGPGRPAGRGLR